MIPFGMFSGASTPPSVSYCGVYFSTTDVSSYSFTGVNIGAAATSRLVVVVLLSSYFDGSDIVTSLTIGGVAATKHVNTGTGNPDVGIFSLSVPAGTSTTVNVTLNTADNRSAIAVFSLYDLQSTSPQSVNSVGGTPASSVSTSVAVKKDGITIVGATGNSGTANTATNWTISVDQDVESNDGIQAGYAIAAADATTTFTLTNAASIAAVHWR